MMVIMHLILENGSNFNKKTGQTWKNVNYHFLHILEGVI